MYVMILCMVQVCGYVFKKGLVFVLMWMVFVVMCLFEKYMGEFVDFFFMVCMEDDFDEIV